MLLLDSLVNNSFQASLDGVGKIFIDTTNLLHTINKRSASWTATEDCICIASINGTSGNGAIVYLDDVSVFTGGYLSGFSTPFATSFYVKKGQTVTTRSNGTYLLNFYALMK